MIGQQPLLALVDIDDRVHADFPSLDQFDHMIVYVPEDNGPGYWVDATNKEAFFDHKAPNGLGGRKAAPIRWETIAPGNYSAAPISRS